MFCKEQCEHALARTLLVNHLAHGQAREHNIVAKVVSASFQRIYRIGRVLSLVYTNLFLFDCVGSCKLIETLSNPFLEPTSNKK
jgi:hypothetical protein